MKHRDDAIGDIEVGLLREIGPDVLEIFSRRPR
jgi:hypothetical protein